jgi:chaperonin GroES
MTIKPLYDRIIVKRDEKEDTTAGGIILSQTNDKPTQGTVKAVGNGTILADGSIVPLIVKVGDRVLFGRGVGIEAKVDDEVLLIMKEHELLGILEK